LSDGPASARLAGVTQPEGTQPKGGRERAQAQPEQTLPQRVRIVLAEVARRRRATRQELTEQTKVGDALIRGLIRAQLALALRLAIVVLIGLGSLPLLFVLAPGVASARIGGIPLPWLLLGVVAYPFLFGIGWVHTRMSERNEREFANLVGRPDRHE